MKNIIQFTVAFFLIGITSCDFLDVVPDDAATLDHAFSNRAVTERFLRTCYNHLPDVTDPYHYPGWYTSRHEVVANDYRVYNHPALQIADGLQNTNNPQLNYWSGTAGGKNLYIAIRDCNIFLNNIHVPRDITEEERTRWTAEVKFLKAYYHYFLMTLYGPIVIADEEVPLGASPEELQVYREPVDVVVDYIVDLLDEAIEDLPLVLPDPNTELGRITKTIAMSVKAKTLVWAASPLFNGNSDYSNWVDNRGIQLVSDTYDPTKWERAAEAIKDAIDAAHEGGASLYTFNKYSGGAQTFQMNDTLVQLMTIRKAITEDADRNPSLIWGSQTIPAPGKGGGEAMGLMLLETCSRCLHLSYMLPTSPPISTTTVYRGTWRSFITATTACRSRKTRITITLGVTTCAAPRPRTGTSPISLPGKLRRKFISTGNLDFTRVSPSIGGLWSLPPPRPMEVLPSPRFYDGGQMKYLSEPCLVDPPPTRPRKLSRLKRRPAREIQISVILPIITISR